MTFRRGVLVSNVSLDRVWKLFGDTPVVRDLSLEAEDGEFLVLVGASGCGKSTTLRMLAGLETPTYGHIRIDDDDVTLVAPGARDVAMVFQNYALYPHMTVRKNLSFGPKSRREPKDEINRNVEVVARTLGLEDYLERTPAALSGGQRQRVALGRLMIRRPRLSLLDEPLSNLDAALRVQMRTELVRLQKELNVTTVYVTHDQVEAMTMGDRIAVLDKGVLLQVDTPERLYDEPATEFVATFIGSPKMNIVPGAVTLKGDTASLACLGTNVPLNQGKADLSIEGYPAPVNVGLRPHDLHAADEAPPRCTAKFDAIVDLVELTGAEAFALVKPAGIEETITIRVPRALRARQGDKVVVAFDPRDVHLFDPDSHVRVIKWRDSDKRDGAKKKEVPVAEAVSLG
jgi:multiple sugar transport system ATP-binding protein